MTQSALALARTALFVPATRPDRFAKAAASGADAIILDLEDAVSPAQKDEARDALAQAPVGACVMVRINGFDTSWHEADLAAVLRSNPAAVMLPKAEPGPKLRALAQRLDAVPIIALVETARGLAGAREVAATPNVARLAFGSIDYCADLDCAHDPQILLPTRSELVLASRLAGLPAPFDGVTTDTRNPDLVAIDAAHARAIGMGGKLLIHPSQIESAARAFRPTEAEIAWARRVLAVADGVATVDGTMVDAPVKIQAKQILARAELPTTMN